MSFVLATQKPSGPESLWIALSHGVFGSHLGVVFPEADGSERLLHLAWHHTLVVEAFPPKSPWIVERINLKPFSSALAIALFRAMSNKGQGPGVKIGYGIKLLAGAGAIGDDGSYSPPPGCDGFTCASIIAEAFRNLGFDMVDLHTWKKSYPNKIWGEAVVCCLCASRVSKDHVEKVRENIDGLRLLPEEMAVAATSSQTTWPVTQSQIKLPAKLLRLEKNRLCGEPEPSPILFAHCVNNYRKNLKWYSFRRRFMWCMEKLFSS